MGVDYIGGLGFGQQPSNLMSFLRNEADNIATAQQPSQLNLAWRPAHLSHYRRGGDRDDAHFEASTVIGPDVALIAVRGDQKTRVVDDAHAERRLPEDRISSATRSRADRSSVSVSGPFSCSHSDAATKPSRNRSARRAAAVIQAETLNPSSAAAATTRSCTSGSTVIASFGEGLPLGIRQVYYQGRRVVDVTLRLPVGLD